MRSSQEKVKDVEENEEGPKLGLFTVLAKALSDSKRLSET